MDQVRVVIGGRTIRAPRGLELSCRGWQQEAALRMLMNNLDPEVAERPEDLVVYGGAGRAAPSWGGVGPLGPTPRPLVGGVRRDRRHAAPARGRRDAAGPVGQARRRVPHARVVAARADRQLQP